MSLYYFCHHCGVDLYLQEGGDEKERVTCPECLFPEAYLKGRTCHVALSGLTTNFNPHFDVTQGKYFSSAEEKKAWLEKKNKAQVGGDFSPKTDGKGRWKCSKDQAKKFFAGEKLKKYIKNEDLHNRKIQIQVGGRG